MKKLVLAVAATLALPFAVANATTSLTYSVPSTMSVYIDKDGVRHYPDANGYITLDSNYANDAFRAGLLPATAYGAAATATCTKGAVITTPVGHHGTVFSCISTNLVVPVGKY